MIKKTNHPLCDHEKQTIQLDGEVSLEEARLKAMLFAVKEKLRINAGKAKKK